MHSPPQPEMSNNVQQYDKKVYLRVSEAQRCHVHSTLVVPLYSADMTHKPVAIFELVQSDKDCPFSTVMAHLQQCLEVRHHHVINRSHSMQRHATTPPCNNLLTRHATPIRRAAAMQIHANPIQSAMQLPPYDN